MVRWSWSWCDLSKRMNCSESESSSTTVICRGCWRLNQWASLILTRSQSTTSGIYSSVSICKMISIFCSFCAPYWAMMQSCTEFCKQCKVRTNEIYRSLQDALFLIIQQAIWCQTSCPWINYSSTTCLNPWMFENLETPQLKIQTVSLQIFLPWCPKSADILSRLSASLYKVLLLFVEANVQIICKPQTLLRSQNKEDSKSLVWHDLSYFAAGNKI